MTDILDQARAALDGVRDHGPWEADGQEVWQVEDGSRFYLGDTWTEGQARFIAWARTGVPELVAEMERLRTRLEERDQIAGEIAARLKETGVQWPDWYAERAIDALTAAGYAVVRLPEPDFTDEDAAAWDGHLYITVDSEGIARLDGTRTPTAELRETAAALLAAADHQEKNR